MGYRRLIVTVVLTAVLAALAQPLYSVGGIWTGIINSRNNKTVRLDLLKTGGKDNRLTFSKMSMLRFSSTAVRQERKSPAVMQLKAA